MKRFVIVGIVLLVIGVLGFGLYFNSDVVAGIKQQIFGDDPDMPGILSRAKSQFSKEDFMQMRAENIQMYRGIFKDQSIDPQSRVRAIREMERQELALRDSLIPQAAWTELGPNPIPNAQVETAPTTTASGRVVAIAVHPTNADTVYVGTAQGGLYRSTNGGTSWTRMMDSALSLAINAIAISPSQPDTIYVGTGEAGFCLDCFSGVGVYRIDNASTASPVLSGPFNQSGAAADLMTGRGVGKIVVHPTDVNTIFVVTGNGSAGINGRATFPTLPDPGLFRSTNAAGASPTFTKLSITGLAFQDYPILDAVIDPNNANNLVVALTDNFGDGVGGLYRTTDALAATPSFTKPLAFTSGANFRADLTSHRDAGTWTIYAAAGEGTGSVYRSTDGGASFALRIDNNFCNPQCFYDIAIAVDPTNAANVYLGGSPNLVFGRSSDSGATFTADGTNFTAGLHVDSHAIAVAPSNPAVVYFGSDGGIYKTTNVSATPIVWTSLNNTTFSATQFMGLDVHSTDINFAIGGTQDNGTNHYRADMTWSRVDFGDGGYAVIDQADTSTTNVDMYHTYFNASTLNGYAHVPNTASASDGLWTFRGCNGVTGNGISCTATVLFYAPLERGPGSPNNTIYYGSNRLYRSDDNGANHTTVSQAFVFPISSIGISPQNDNVRMIGGRDGAIFGTTTGATTLVDMDPTNIIPNNFVARTVIDPQNANTAYVTLTTFTTTNIWKTTNLSSFADQGLLAPTWTASATGLPQVPVNAFMVDPIDSNRLYAGTDIGVYTSGDGGANWTPFGTGLPRVAVFDIAMTAGTIATRQVKIATHGRGMWQVPALAPSAAGVSVSGRVSAQNGAGVAGAIVSITDQSGNKRQTRTSAFGYYSFDDVGAGQTYTVEVAAKRYQFNPQIVNVQDNIQDLDFTAVSAEGKAGK